MKSIDVEVRDINGKQHFVYTVEIDGNKKEIVSKKSLTFDEVLNCIDVKEELDS